MGRVSRDLRGRWSGTYSYDLPATGILPGPPANFEITITQTWLQRTLGRFRGTVTDVQTQIDQGTGSIRGRVDASSIRFVKQMPVAFVQQNGRAILVSEHLAELGYAGLPNPRGALIHYEGQFEDSERASGSWIICEGPLVVARGVSLLASETTGTSTMRRAD